SAGCHGSTGRPGLPRPACRIWRPPATCISASTICCCRQRSLARAWPSAAIRSLPIGWRAASWSHRSRSAMKRHGRTLCSRRHMQPSAPRRRPSSPGWSPRWQARPNPYPRESAMADPGATHRADETPSAWVVRWRHLLRPGMNVLDLACGHGRHARYLAGCGCRVTAVDRDPDALASLAGNPAVEVMALDLEGGWWPFAGRQFDAIVVVRYLHRPLLPALLDSLASDGLLIYETFMRGNEVYGRPSNPDFLLAPD